MNLVLFLAQAVESEFTAVLTVAGRLSTFAVSRMAPRISLIEEHISAVDVLVRSNSSGISEILNKISNLEKEIKIAKVEAAVNLASH